MSATASRTLRLASTESRARPASDGEVQWQTAAFGRRRRKPRVVDRIDEIVERMRTAESDADQPPCGATHFDGQPPDELGTFAAR